MRTTIRLDDQLLRAAKQHAYETGTTLTALIEDALRQVLSRRMHSRSRTSVKLTTVGGRGILPGIDLDDTAALLSVMEDGSRGSV